MGKLVPCNSDYFKKVDTEEKAYWLGFLLADGNVYGNRVQIQLSAKDEEHLKKWHLAVGFMGKLYPYVRRHDGKEYHYVASSISSKTMCEHLSLLGCFPRKSGKINWPSIPQELDWHLLRGYFDGDGSAVVRQRKTERPQIAFKVVANQSFLEYAREMLKCKATIRSAGSQSDFVQQLVVEGNRQAKKAFDLIYRDATVWLTRKRQLVDDHFRRIDLMTGPIDAFLYEAYGEKKTFRAWLSDSRCVATRTSLRKRLSQGWKFHEAVSTPTKKYRQRKQGLI